MELALSPDLAILRHLASRTHASAVEVGAACRMKAAEVCARLVSLESRRLVASRTDKAPRRRVGRSTSQASGVVGGVVGGAVGGVVGGARGVLGLPHRRDLPGHHSRRYHRRHR